MGSWFGGITWSVSPPSWVGKRCCKRRREGVSACLEPSHLHCCLYPWSTDCWIWKKWVILRNRSRISCLKKVQPSLVFYFFCICFSISSFFRCWPWYSKNICNQLWQHHPLVFHPRTPCLPSFPTRIWSNKLRQGATQAAAVAFGVNTSNDNIRVSSAVLNSWGQN